MEVDQAREEDQALALDHLGTLGVEAGADGGHGLPVDQDVLRFAAEQARPADQRLGVGGHDAWFSSEAGAGRFWATAGSFPPSSR